MKIVEVNSYVYGSTGKIMKQIAYIAEEEHFDVFQFCAAAKSNKIRISNNQQMIGSLVEKKLNECINYFFGFNGVGSIVATLNFISSLKKIKPDILHLHNLHNSYLNLPLLFKYIKEENVKVVWTLHDCWSFTGHCAYFDMANCEKWKVQCEKCNSKKVYPKSLVDNSKVMFNFKKKWFTNVNDLIIVTPSIWLKNQVKQSFLKKYPVITINNGIDLKIFKQKNANIKEKYNISKDKIILLGVSLGWGERKGLNTFCRLAKELDSRYQIVLVGTNDKIDSLLPKNIISVHSTYDQNELADMYSMADIFINPTLEENFPTVNIESMACGTPIITYSTGGSSEMIDERTGVVIERNNYDELKKAILEFDSRKYNDYDCIKRAEKYEKNKCFKEYIKIYKEYDQLKKLYRDNEL